MISARRIFPSAGWTMERGSMLYTQMPFCFRFSGGFFLRFVSFWKGDVGGRKMGKGERALTLGAHLALSLSVGRRGRKPRYLPSCKRAWTRRGRREVRRPPGSLAGMQRQRKPEPAMINAAPHPRSKTSRLRKRENPPPFSIVWVSGGGSLRRSRARNSKKS